MNIKEAAQRWVSRFNELKLGMLAKLMSEDIDSWQEVTIPEKDMDVSNTEYDDFLPMWDTIWSFSDSCDESWIEGEENLQLMSDCGFRIYRHDEWGYFFGIDGAGYDFYEGHWIPLYKARGLKWHDE